MDPRPWYNLFHTSQRSRNVHLAADDGQIYVHCIIKQRWLSTWNFGFGDPMRDFSF
jgi:hypothetical protein